MCRTYNTSSRKSQANPVTATCHWIGAIADVIHASLEVHVGIFPPSINNTNHNKKNLKHTHHPASWIHHKCTDDKMNVDTKLVFHCPHQRIFMATTPVMDQEIQPQQLLAMENHKNNTATIIILGMLWLSLWVIPNTYTNMSTATTCSKYYPNWSTVQYPILIKLNWLLLLG